MDQLGNSNVLVTGCAGFIGFHAVRSLLDIGCKVYGIDCLSESYYPAALKAERLKRLATADGFRFVCADLAEAVPAHLSGIPFDYVVHLAAEASVLPSFARAADYVRNNVLATQVLFDWAASRQVRHLVYASSSSVYGDRDSKTPWREDAPLAPISPYGATKVANEAQAEVLSRSARLTVTGLRFFKVYGPWARPDTVFYRFVERVHGGQAVEIRNKGNISHSFTYIDDAIDALISALGQTPSRGEKRHRVYNIAGERQTSLDEILDIIEKTLGTSAKRVMVPLPSGDRSHSSAELTAARRDLDFRNRTAIEDGLPRFIEWFLSYSGEETSALPKV